jgi:hypothetical protein
MRSGIRIAGPADRPAPNWRRHRLPFLVAVAAAALVLRAKAVRFSTLEALCEALDCQPGDILRWVADEAVQGPAGSTRRG